MFPMPRRRHRSPLLAAAAFTLAGCNSFATPRTAVVRPGVTWTAQASLAQDPGEIAGWMWSFDCVDRCGHKVPALDLLADYGATAGPVAWTIGGGINGVVPYVDGYVQLARWNRLPVGVGARAGVTPDHSSRQLYARLDLPLAPDVRLIWNPSLFRYDLRSPNYDPHPMGSVPSEQGSRASFTAVASSVGLELAAGRVAVTPAMSVVRGRAERTRYGEHDGPERRTFVTVSVGLSRRPAPR
jgi:hypothetical protein